MDNSEKLILALFSKSPYALKPWADAGYYCKNIDMNANEGFDGNQFFVAMNLSDIDDVIDYIEEGGIKPSLILSFPPCDDLAVCGAKHFKSKAAADPEFQKKALNLFSLGERLAAHYGCPCLTENPVSVASTLYRKRDVEISPHEYGGYLPENDEHPEWPSYIAPRDAYRKKTWYWLMNGFLMPPKKPVPLYDHGIKSALGMRGNSKQFLKLGGKSEKTKTIRSLTPRGVFVAIYEAMKGRI